MFRVDIWILQVTKSSSKIRGGNGGARPRNVETRLKYQNITCEIEARNRTIVLENSNEGGGVPPDRYISQTSPILRFGLSALSVLVACSYYTYIASFYVYSLYILFSVCCCCYTLADKDNSNMTIYRAP